MAWGEYPPEYNPKVHGVYDPGRYYGKKDTKLGETKLGELPGWIMRRSKNPIAWVQCCGRAYWRWNHRWMFPVNAGLSGPLQMVGGLMLFFYCLNYSKYWKHANYKYHW